MTFNFGKRNLGVKVQIRFFSTKKGEGYSDCAPSFNVRIFSLHQVVLRHQLDVSQM